MILNKEFYKQGALILAKELLGKVVVRTVNNLTLKAKIVETEAYVGEIDKASHAYNGRRTDRTEPLFREGGIAYVYFIYGKYYCFNVISGIEDKGEGVLVRALEPLNEFDYLARKRFGKSFDELSETNKKALTNGPSKLCIAFSIDKSENYKKLYEEGDFYIEDSNDEKFDIVETTRIGIDYAEEAIDFPWRFYIKDNKYISKK
ncbi:DNA-3-methyladenine glycosylase [Clostridium saccharoperbutylacetonicum]|uniref:DNA-3-methyladenine glycosylase n=1 Tax=Clostridium saccharoperbutylacetonicum TaxID=36745 RepID=UPI0009839307|nr:DNA-3-methyladenine glycosylase [Clostridium saccharoperbutylacetonicum]AQR92824.1 putative 3-methyladenine DNA glycosylase [Clostridium saccharoperbutylacetonicum]NSB34235.1 DNA-3-methyladenine glycosylase [Clostridium saccharoperbutylacetonicum]